MSLVAIILPALLGLFLWMYLLTYFMYRGAGKDFFVKARSGFLRGVAVAGVFIIFDTTDFLSSFIGNDWIIFPIIFFLFSVPFSWRLIWKKSIIPIIMGLIVFFGAYFFSEKMIFWSPFHEEVGKWYQSITVSYPALLSPFVSLGFSFIENIRYYSVDISWWQILWRNLFSLPLHIFVGLLAFWCFFRSRSRILWVILGLTAAVSAHALYNWSLESSLILTLGIMVSWYAFYGWSLENGWWKRKI